MSEATAKTASSASPVGELMRDRDYRNFLFAQVLYSGVNGTLRFTFIWLMVTLTDWESAEGLVAMALGLPAMFLSLPAGAWSDRVDRKRLYMSWTAATAIAMGLFTVLIASGNATPLLTVVAAGVIGTAISVNSPNVQAIVPLLVPRERLMNAVALQNGAGQAAGFAGLAIGGLAIQLVGDAGGFGLLTVLTALSIMLIARVDIPADEVVGDGTPEPMFASIIAGAKFGLGHDPLRTLLLLAVMLGGSFSVMQISMPRVVEDVYGQEAGVAGIVLGAFGIGMLVSSIAVSRRSEMRHGLNIAIFIGLGLGLGQFLVSFAPSAWIAMAIMFAWGLNAGIAMTSHRTLMQTNTPPEMMGRVMGLMMLGFAGSLPIGALTSSVLAPQLGAQVTMRVVGAITMVVTMSLTFRRSIIALR